ncbi:apolipo protein O-domain-containing protein [Chaetomium sp. MPI-SDFR-AT-0129]|uniref:MICOS complex subunit n=1 Tax=Dichotomopilus funicola TaxID=1934379 RepID=A0AAN6V601_9PEZI|nr:apolipo protein O-domain-containing protein [Chaetomium sp. MPI-SDFR-AT-0129]KAK4145513.1 micos subunit MIC26 [Dichotomopilus funicola]
MAARVLLQRRIAPLTAAALVGGVALYPQIAHAEPPSERQFSRKPIYEDEFDYLSVTKPAPPSAPTAAVPPSTPPAPSEETLPAPVPDSSSSPLSSLFGSEPTTTPTRTRAPTPTDRLAVEIRRARLFLYTQSCLAEDSINNALSHAFALERSFTSTLTSLAPPRESGERLMPGTVYVLVAGMAGSIVARNRNILFRGVAPLALGLGAAWAVLPVTMGNVSALAWEYEKKVPALADAHLRAREGVEQGVDMARVHAQVAQRKVYEGVRDARLALEGWVQNVKS